MTPTGSDGSILLVVTDITETRRIEAVRRDFVANASHELKTPAASIQAAAETLVSVAHRDPAAVPRFASQLEREAMRLSRIVADLLDLSRLESGSELGERVRLDALVREEVERFEERAREAGISARHEHAGSGIGVGLAPRPVAAGTQPHRQRDPLHEPVRDASRSACEPDDAQVALVVADDGMGIPTRDISRVFERFYRVDRARSRETGGTGLGLAIVKHVAENHGGSVEVVSELGAGSTFTVTLPAAADACGRNAHDVVMTTLFLIRHGLTAQTGTTLYGQTRGIRSRPSRPGAGRPDRRPVRGGEAHRDLLEPAGAMRRDRGTARSRAAVARGGPRRPDRDGCGLVDRAGPSQACVA